MRVLKDLSNVRIVLSKRHVNTSVPVNEKAQGILRLIKRKMQVISPRQLRTLYDINSKYMLIEISVFDSSV